MEDDVNFICTMDFNHCKLRSWIEYDGEKFIGMGSKTTYDKDGRLVDYTEGPTGITMTMGD